MLSLEYYYICKIQLVSNKKNSRQVFEVNKIATFYLFK
jgi:hypothetical protein